MRGSQGGSQGGSFKGLSGTALLDSSGRQGGALPGPPEARKRSASLGDSAIMKTAPGGFGEWTQALPKALPKAQDEAQPPYQNLRYGILGAVFDRVKCDMKCG